MDDLLQVLARRPEPFSTGGPSELWTDPHVQAMMLAYHLDPTVDAASPPHETIDRAVAWLVEHVGIDRTSRVLDLGCGPGLYTARLAPVAAHVYGIDLSSTSIAAARQHTPADTSTFTVGDYLDDPLPAHDVALLLMYDYGAMSPEDRRRLLARVRARMAPGGRLVLDALAAPRFAKVQEGCRIEERLDDGFWAPGDYLGVAQTFRYDEVRVSLDRYLIVEPTRTRWVHNWTAYLTPDEVTTEVEAAGFVVSHLLGDVTGQHRGPTEDTLAVVARAA